MGTQAVELPAPPTALLSHWAPEPHMFLLDGQGPSSWGDGRSRFASRPVAQLRLDGLAGGEVRRGRHVERWDGDPFELLERFCAEHLPRAGAEAGRIVVVALNYDLRLCVERHPRPAPADPALPLLVASAYDWLLSYSWADAAYTLETAGDPNAAREVLARVSGVDPSRRPDTAESPPRLQVAPERAREVHEEAVRRALEYIAAGDVYQVNVAQRFAGRGRFDPIEIFRGMQRRNSVPFAAYLDLGDLALLSNSPECFLVRDGSLVRTFPIKGTRRRGLDVGEDLRLTSSLADDAKERAEHVMVVDLERNDLGRVCRPGSVRVQSLADVQTFPGLHHMVSEVRGHLRPDVGLADLLRAAFPGGSVTGAPKIRAMQIIDELEPWSRGFYTGALGYIRSLDQSVFSLTIRTAMARGDRIWYWAGGGIVADSVPAAEYEETMLKAQPFLEACRGR